MIEIIENLTKLGTRQGKMAQKARDYICEVLDEKRIPFVVEKFPTHIPVNKKAELMVDGKRAECLGCGLRSGEIPTTDIASSLMSSKLLIDKAVIYCNPMCRVPTPTNFSFGPAIAVSPAVLKKLFTSKKSQARILVRKTKVQSNFILVGNTGDPKTIVFSHFDSLGPGAIDNASGTAVALNAAITLREQNRLDDVLFVFDGNEEISYDYPTYWGHGYRVFESRYFSLLKRARQIIIVDSIGQGGSAFITDPKIINLAFPLARIKELGAKVAVLSGNFERLMAVYHSRLDLPGGISLKDLKQARKLLLDRIQKNRGRRGLERITV